MLNYWPLTEGDSTADILYRVLSLVLYLDGTDWLWGKGGRRKRDSN
jgi:hypothetical protein